jgi:unsaturated rhamnogalacturonyl hydrolase
LKGFENIWHQTADRQYFDFIKHSMDKFVQPDGSIRTYNLSDHNLDFILCGRNVLMLYQQTHEDKYLKAVQTLREQLRTQPRTFDGGFWHKKRYPNQMWLDGLYMAEPFYAEYAAIFHEDTAFNDIARQFILMEKHSRDEKTGLLYHAWDASKNERWADPQTGRSPNFWGRAMGWYGMALVDALDQFPANHPRRKELLAILQRYAVAVQRWQDKPTGLWYEVLDKGTEKGNYQEASVSCMFVYTLAKAVRQKYLPASYIPIAQKGYAGIIKKFIRTDDKGLLALDGTVQVGGLGGKPYRDGSYAYYLSEKVITNDAKGVGAFILAATEIEWLKGKE